MEADKRKADSEIDVTVKRSKANITSYKKTKDLDNNDLIEILSDKNVRVQVLKKAK